MKFLTIEVDGRRHHINMCKIYAYTSEYDEKGNKKVTVSYDDNENVTFENVVTCFTEEL